MSGENYNSPHESPESFRGFKASDLLDVVKESESIRKLQSIRSDITELLFVRDLDDDEKDLIVCIDLRIETLREQTRHDIAKIREIARREAKQESDTLLALDASFYNSQNDEQLYIDEEARIALFKKPEKE